MKEATPFSESVPASLACLIAGGAPIGARVPGVPPTVAELVGAARTLMRSPSVESWVLEAIAAYVLAWSHEWPCSFREAFGEDASGVVAFWSERIGDRGRYVKLRRIAIANLAHRL